jgi:hypothetical protein
MIKRRRAMAAWATGNFVFQAATVSHVKLDWSVISKKQLLFELSILSRFVNDERRNFSAWGHAKVPCFGPKLLESHLRSDANFLYSGLISTTNSVTITKIQKNA